MTLASGGPFDAFQGPVGAVRSVRSAIRSKHEKQKPGARVHS